MTPCKFLSRISACLAAGDTELSVFSSFSSMFRVQKGKMLDLVVPSTLLLKGASLADILELVDLSDVEAMVLGGVGWDRAK